MGASDGGETVVRLCSSDEVRHHARVGVFLRDNRRRGDSKFLDFTIKTKNNEKIKMSSIVGAVHSETIRDYLASLRRNGGAASSSGADGKQYQMGLNMPEFRCDRVIKVVDYMYNAHTEVNLDKIDEYLEVAAALGVKSLHKQLEMKFLSSAESKPENRVKYLNIAADPRHKLSNDTLNRLIRIVAKTHDALSTSDINRLSVQSMTSLLQSDAVPFNQKIDLINLALLWLRADEQRMEEVDHVLGYIYIQHLKSHELRAFIKHLRRQLFQPETRHAVHVYSDTGSRVIVSTDPKKFVANSGVVVPTVEEPNFASSASSRSTSQDIDSSSRGRRFTQSQVDSIRKTPNIFPQSSSKSKGYNNREVQYSRSQIEEFDSVPNPFFQTAVAASPSQSLKSNASLQGIRYTQSEAESIQKLPNVFNAAPSQSRESNASLQGIRYTPSEVDLIRQIPNVFKAAPSQSRESNASLYGIRYTPSEAESIRKLPNVFNAAPSQSRESNASLQGIRYTPSEVDLIRQIPNVFKAAPSQSLESLQGIRYTPSEVDSIKQIPNVFNAAPSQSRESNASLHGIRYTPSEAESIRKLPNVFNAAKSQSLESLQGIRYTPSEVDSIKQIPNVFSQSSQAQQQPIRGYDRPQNDTLKNVPNAFGQSGPSQSQNSVATIGGVYFTPAEVEALRKVLNVIQATPSPSQDIANRKPSNVFPQTASAPSQSRESNASLHGIRYTPSEAESIRKLPNMFNAAPSQSLESNAPLRGIRYTESEVDLIKQIPNPFQSNAAASSPAKHSSKSTKKFGDGGNRYVSTAKSPSSSEGSESDIKSSDGGSERDVRSPQGSTTLLNRDLRSPSEVLELRGYPSFVDGPGSPAWTKTTGLGNATRQISSVFQAGGGATPSSSQESNTTNRGLSYTQSEVDSIRKLPNVFNATPSQSLESNASSMRGLRYTQSEVDAIRQIPNVFNATSSQSRESNASLHGIRYTPSEAESIRKLPNVFNAPSASKDSQPQHHSSTKKLFGGAK